MPDLFPNDVAYDPMAVFDRETGEPLASIRGQNGRVVLRDTDVAIDLLDWNRLALTQPITVSDVGFIPAFIDPQGVSSEGVIRELDFVSGPARMPITSLSGLEKSAAASMVASEAAREEARAIKELADAGAFKGAPGDPGPQGDRGLPGVNAVPAAAAVAEYVQSGPVKPILDAGYVRQNGESTGRPNFSGAFSSRATYNPGNPAATGGAPGKPPTDLAPGVIDWSHDSPIGYLLHFQTRQSGAHPARTIGIGLDHPKADGTKGTGGILIAQKAASIGIEIEHRSTVTGADSWGLYVTQSNAESAAVRFEQNNEAGAPVLQMMSGVSGSSGADLLHVVAGGGTAGRLKARNGEWNWFRPFKTSDDGTTVNFLEASSALSTPEGQRNYTRMRKDSLTFYGYSGTTGTWFPQAIVGGGNKLQIRTAGSTTDLTAVPTNVMLSVEHNKIGFFGAAAVNKPAALPGDATDLATALALVNYLKNSVIKPLGLAS